MNNKLFYGGIAAIVNLILLLPLIVLEIFKQELPSGLLVAYLLVLLASLISAVVMYIGFAELGRLTKLAKLRTIAFVLVAIEIIFQSLSVVDLFLPFADSSILAGIIILEIAGVSILLLGIFQLPLKKQFGGLAKAIAILNIIAGIGYITVLLFFISVLLVFPIVLLQGILLIKASKMKIKAIK